jgi:hypothetical protein
MPFWKLLNSCVRDLETIFVYLFCDLHYQKEKEVTRASRERESVYVSERERESERTALFSVLYVSGSWVKKVVCVRARMRELREKRHFGWFF